MAERRRFEGVLNILDFNRHFYFIGVAFLTIVIAGGILVHWLNWTFWLVIIMVLYGLIAPLIVSAYVYDFSGFYTFKWLKDIKSNWGEAAKSIVNINAGFDETSFILEENFPDAELHVFDFYNSERHTERAIRRARAVSKGYPGTMEMTFGRIPMKDSSVDVVFLISSVHEIRSHHEKVGFLKECRRVCRPDGVVVLVEHLRDFPNFLAFTIGLTHFFPRRIWVDAFKQSEFSHLSEKKFTWFMSIFECKP